MLELKNLSIALTDSGKEIVKNVSFACPKGSVTACMGPNGSGKSSLLHTIMGSPLYQVTGGQILYNGQDITQWPVDKRARAGLFLTLQQPYEIPGVLVGTLLKESFRALGTDQSMDEYIDRLALGCSLLAIDRSMLDRGVHAGFSGGEKKKLEMLQVFVLQPMFLMFDELDSGLDIDARQLVGKALQEFKRRVPDVTIIMVTHHNAFFAYLQPDFVHIMAHGEVKKSGDAALLNDIEAGGYGK